MERIQNKLNNMGGTDGDGNSGNGSGSNNSGDNGDSGSGQEKPGYKDNNGSNSTRGGGS